MRTYILGLIGLLCLVLILPGLTGLAQTSPLGQGSGGVYEVPTGTIPVGPVMLGCPKNCKRALQEVFRVTNKSRYPVRLTLKSNGHACGIGAPPEVTTAAGYNAGVLKPGQMLNLDNKFTHGFFFLDFTPLPQGKTYRQVLQISNPFGCPPSLPPKTVEVTDEHILSVNPGLQPTAVNQPTEPPAKKCSLTAASLTVINHSNQKLAIKNRLEAPSLPASENLGTVSPASSQLFSKVVLPGKNTLTFTPLNGGPAITKTLEVMNECERTALKTYKITIDFNAFDSAHAGQTQDDVDCQNTKGLLFVDNRTDYSLRVTASEDPICKGSDTSSSLLQAPQIASGAKYKGLVNAHSKNTYGFWFLKKGCNQVYFTPYPNANVVFSKKVLVNKQCEKEVGTGRLLPLGVTIVVDPSDIPKSSSSKNPWPHAHLKVNNNSTFDAMVVLIRKPDARDFLQGNFPLGAVPPYLVTEVQSYRNQGYSDYFLGTILSGNSNTFQRILPPGRNDLLFIYTPNPGASNPQMVKRTLSVQNAAKSDGFTFEETLNPGDFRGE